MSVLDLPVWYALKGRQSMFARGTALALSYDPAISLFAAASHQDDASLIAVANLVPAQGMIIFLQRSEMLTPVGCDVAFTGTGIQMVLTTGAKLHPAESFVELGEPDVPDMLALAELTKPGPFLRGTPKLGGFVGIRRNGKLAAMAGERFKPDGFTEVSGVCTHPDFRGQGLAGALSSVVATRILARGETPFLHAFSSNTSAIALYEKLGFEKRCDVHVKALKRNEF